MIMMELLSADRKIIYILNSCSFSRIIFFFGIREQLEENDTTIILSLCFLHDVWSVRIPILSGVASAENRAHG